MLTYVHSKVTRKKVDRVDIFNRAAMTGFLGKSTKSGWKNDRKHGSVAMTLFQIIRSLKIFRIHQLKKKKKSSFVSLHRPLSGCHPSASSREASAPRKRHLQPRASHMARALLALCVKVPEWSAILISPGPDLLLDPTLDNNCSESFLSFRLCDFYHLKISKHSKLHTWDDLVPK